MSSNFDRFLSAVTSMLPAVGQAVVTLHPDNAQEALKIQVGTALIQGIVAALHQSSVPAADPVAPPQVATPPIQPSAQS